jgi:hypothetical protein
MSPIVKFDRVEAIVLGLGAVDQLHVEGVTDDEREVLLSAAVGEPVPAEHAFHADDDVFAERRDGLKQRLEVTGQAAVADDRASRVQDTQVHRPCMQVDAGVKSVLLVREPHHGLLGLGGA